MREIIAYPVETAFTTVDSNNLSNSVVLCSSVVDVCSLHHGAKLHIRGLVNAAGEVLC